MPPSTPPPKNTKPIQLEQNLPIRRLLLLAGGLVFLRVNLLLLGQHISPFLHWLIFYGLSLGLSVGVVCANGQHRVFDQRFGVLFLDTMGGLWQGLIGFASVLLVGWTLLYVPWLQPWWPGWLLDLLDLLDPWPTWVLMQQNIPWQNLHWWLGGVGGGLEEWLFRGVLFWGWLTPAQRYDAHSTSWWRLAQPQYWALMRVVLGKALFVGVFFALLHLPASPEQLLSVVLGSMMLSWVLWRQQSLLSVALLHALFNLKVLL